MGKSFFPILFCFAFICGTLFFFFAPDAVRADLIEDLKSKIDERNKVIADLENEIKQYQAEVEKTGTQAKSLKIAINNLELTRKKLTSEIKLLENRITSATLTISEYDVEINRKLTQIEDTKNMIGDFLRERSMAESDTLAEVFLSGRTLSAFMDNLEALSDINVSLRASLNKYRDLKKDLDDKKQSAELKRKELQNLAVSLADKKKVAEYNKAENNKLLIATKNKEANYKKILEQKQALRDAFEQELLDYESQLKFAIDPTSLPQIGSGVLKWPVDSVTITQKFGDTDFARSHPQAYNGKGHNGIDLKAPTGTAIKASLTGKVIGVGNTDNACPGASYGKWVLIEHPNGLSTLYAHLSVIKVTADQEVVTGEVVGYSGETGYATGPHLHFTVYATQGVKIVSRPSKICRATYTMPIASFNGYLNPLLYL